MRISKSAFSYFPLKKKILKSTARRIYYHKIEDWKWKILVARFIFFLIVVPFEKKNISKKLIFIPFFRIPIKLHFIHLNSRYFAGGSDDGSVYIYDLRKPCTGYVSRLMGGSSKHTNPNHSNGYNRSPITDAAFHSIKSNILVVSTLEGEILRFE